MAMANVMDQRRINANTTYYNFVRTNRKLDGPVELSDVTGP